MRAEAHGQHREGLLYLVVFAMLETAMIGWRIDAAPLAWIAFLWAAVLGVALIMCAFPHRALWAANAAAVLVAVGLAETLLFLTGPRNPYVLPAGVRFVGDLARPNYFVEMPVAGLGYRPRPGMRVLAVKVAQTRILYRVQYSTESDGLRRRPPVIAEPQSCLLMFGDSMAWGEGVADEETAAYAVGSQSGGAVRVANFAFTGYSAHQMLWQISDGDVTQKSGCDPTRPVLAVYQTLPNNVRRVAGLRGWDTVGPRYVLEDGHARYAGSFADGDYLMHDRVHVPAALSRVLGRSELYSRIFGADRRLDGFDIERFCAVVKAASTRLSAIYPHLRFVVIVWPEELEGGNPVASTATLVHALEAHGLTVYDASSILPSLRTNPAAAGIAGDGHPTAATHRALAEYLVAEQGPFLALTPAILSR